MIKEFKPKSETNDSFDEPSFIQIIKNGELNRALKICRNNNVPVEKYYHQFMEGARKLILSHRTSELLSFIYNHPNIIKVDKIEILKKTLDNGDYHGFLKNSFRFKIYVELKNEIDLAITKIRQEEGVSWRNKFDKLI